jgi:Spy/CpxP family protein refolding chaperone
MKNKTIALLAVPALIAISTFSIANSESKAGCDSKQENSEKRANHSARNPERMLEKLTEKLALSEQQQTAIKSLFEKQQSVFNAAKESRTALHDAVRNLDINTADYAEQLTKVKEQAGLRAQNKIDNLMAIKQGMTQILTAEQLKQFEELNINKGKYKQG